ncbi:MAG TPA: protein-L-isoaspartate(D-aspartate) O-methyltransferase [Acidimicrobiales bacterium]|nr:protein-L-isoaspartate(D-aspartate) O-methyltransferase [Acidimicrobiales bacterium]
MLARIAASQGVRDPRLLAAIRAVARVGFVPRQFAELAELDEPVPIGHHQVTTQPSLVAAMIEALELQGDEVVLEVGTGFGYQTALLARVAAHVWSIERFADLADAARANLGAAGITNADVVVGDGSAGLAEHAPYDAVVVSAAFPTVPQPLADQLVVGGRLVQPMGPGGSEEVVVFGKEPSGLRRVRTVTYARFVRLVGRHGYVE